MKNRLFTNPTWATMLEHFKIFKEQKGHPLVPRDYISKGDHYEYQLGPWVQRIRKVNQDGLLSDAEIEIFNEAGFVFNVNEYRDQAKHRALKAFYDKHGHCRIPIGYCDETGLQMKGYVSRLRKLQRCHALTQAEVDHLNSITGQTVFVSLTRGMEDRIQLFADYIAETGDKAIHRHATFDGRNIGDAAAATRNQYKRNLLSKADVEALESIGFVWSVRELNYQTNLKLLTNYVKETGDLNPPTHLTIDGRRIGTWLNNLRAEESRGTLTTEKRLAVESMGIRIGPIRTTKAPIRKTAKLPSFNDYLALLKEYMEQTGDRYLIDRIVFKDVKLYMWIRGLRQKHMKNGLSLYEIQSLEAIGFTWTIREAKFKANLDSLHCYIKETGDRSPSNSKMHNGVRIGSWLANRRIDASTNTLKAHHREAIESIGVSLLPARERKALMAHGA